MKKNVKLSIDWKAKVALLDNKKIKLTHVQLRILERFFKTPNTVVKTEDIYEEVYGNKKPETMKSRKIPTHISDMRSRVPELAQKIVNVYGKGYMYHE